MLLLLACTNSQPAPGSDSAAVDSAAGEDTAPAPLDYAASDGPFPVSSSQETLGGQPVALYVPEGDGPFPVVVWSHGFARKGKNHADAAKHAASWGFLVAAPDLPSMADHQANAEYVAFDLLPEIQALPAAGTTVAMVGHSAGGLVALLAAAEVGADLWVGLDAVDVSGIGAAVDQDVVGSALLLHGEPSTCNSNGDGTDWTTGGEQWTVHVVDADHCDFESNTDTLCTGFCGQNDEARQAKIQEYAVAWLVAHTGGTAADWLPGGAVAEADKQAGVVDF